VKKGTKIILAIASGLLLALSFPPIPFYLLAFIGFVPIFFLFEEFSDIKHKYFYLYITFFLYHAISNWWIGSWQAETDPYLTASAITLAIFHPFFFMVPFIGFFYLKNKIGSSNTLWLFPFLWVCFEWLHSLGEFSYPWLTIGNTQIYNYHWIQFVDITGVWGASFLICLVNVIIFKGIINYRTISKRHLNKEIIIKYGLSILLIFSIPAIYSVIRIHHYNHEYLLKYNPTATIGVVQPNINPWRKWDGSVESQIAVYQSLQDSLIKAVSKPDLMIWCETAIPTHTRINNIYDYQGLKRWSDSSNVSLMTGVAELLIFSSKENATSTARQFRDDSSAYFESYNSAMMINPHDMNPAKKYQKMKLTPFAERLPYSQYLLFMRSWFEWGVGISAWGIGKEQVALTAKKKGKSFSIAPIICIESVYPDFVSNFARKGAGIFSVITNDSWYDYTPGPEQHFLIAKMRAIENRRYLARSANSGVSGFISATGKTLEKLPQYKRGALSATVPIINDISFYTRFGGWFPTFSSLLILAVFIFIRFFKKTK
jgi:apolipoprotein N-acyltransferase